jgi:hypothetical protein
VTFTLTGFSTVKRDIRVSVGGTAEQNAQLKISQMAEEITVQGEAPWWTRPETRSAPRTTRSGSVTRLSVASASST